MSIEDYRDKLRRYRASLLAERDATADSDISESIAQDSLTLRESALAELQSESAVAQQRLASLQWLKVHSFGDPELPEWLPRFRDGLRAAAASDHPALREAAFETLIALGDSQSQQALIDSLRSRTELVSDELTLRLLSQDPHASARDVAQEFAGRETDEAVRLEALRVLASDTASADRFADLIADGTESESVRTLAATALNSLDRNRFRTLARSLSVGLEGIETSEDSAVRAHLNRLLELPE